MNKPIFKILLSAIITAAAFYTAFYIQSVKVLNPALAHSILTLEYKAEAAVTEHLFKKLKNPAQPTNPISYEIMPAHIIELSSENGSLATLYKVKISYPYVQREFLIRANPQCLDELSFE